jgi:hypothetical protein
MEGEKMRGIIAFTFLVSLSFFLVNFNNLANARDPLTAIDSAIPLPNGVKLVSLEGVWEDRPTHSDVVAGTELWSLPRLSLGMGMGDWAEFGIAFDILEQLKNGSNAFVGGGSPRLMQKFKWTEQEGWTPALGMRVGFKWPASNEPFEVDSGDFAVTILASWQFKNWFFDFNMGPAIYGDRIDAESQNHTWVWSFSGTHIWKKLGLALKQEILLDNQLANTWYQFWDAENGPFRRQELATSLAWNMSESVRLTARYERSLIDTGVRQGVSFGGEWTF